MSVINFQALCAGAIRRRAMYKQAAAVLTPEAEQAAMAPPPEGMPPDAGMPPAGAPPAGGAPAPGGAPAGGQLPPEIMQDQGFIEWLAQQGVMLDQASGQFIDQQSGQPIPPDMIMQAYQAYQQEMQGGQGGMPPEAGGMPPEAGGMPPEAGGMPPAGMPPEDASAGPEGAPQQGGDPTSDQMFIQFMQEAMGVPFDPQSGQFIDPQSGQPIPPEMIDQAYQQFMQQVGGGQEGPGGQPGEMPQGDDPMKQMTEQIESIVDSVVDARLSPMMKKIEALDEKLEQIMMTLEAMQDTDDQRDKESRDQAKQLRDEISADLNPTTEKTAAVTFNVMPDLQPAGTRVATPAVPNMFDLVMGGRK